MQYFLSVIALIAALLGIWNYVSPRISVSASGSVREHEALGTIFNLSNNGSLTIHEVKIRCGIHNLQEPGQRPLISNITVIPYGSDLGNLEAGKTVGLPCENIIWGAQQAEGDIVIEVSYRPDFWHWRKHTYFRFISEKTDDGTWVWKPMTDMNVAH